MANFGDDKEKSAAQNETPTGTKNKAVSRKVHQLSGNYLTFYFETALSNVFYQMFWWMTYFFKYLITWMKMIWKIVKKFVVDGKSLSKTTPGKNFYSSR